MGILPYISAWKPQDSLEPPAGVTDLDGRWLTAMYL
jgi:hypothetical protein